MIPFSLRNGVFQFALDRLRCKDQPESAPCFHRVRIREYLIAIPVGVVAVVPLRMAAIPGPWVVVGSPIRGIGIALAVVMTVVIMPVAYGDA